MTKVQVLQTNAYARAYKKLHNQQKDSVDLAVTAILSDPTLGNAKKGDLAGIYVYKFNCLDQQMLLAYEYDANSRTLLLVGVHENFYKKLKLQT